MKEDILKLRSEGKSYKDIQKQLGCSKGTIAYHCGEGQKEKTANRRRKRRENILIKKVESFKARKSKNFKEVVRKFNKTDSKRLINKNIKMNFTYKDILAKFGLNTTCYISGESINLLEDDYELDHIIPVSRGGDNSIDNLGIVKPFINKMKNTITLDELFNYCKKILEYNKKL